MTTTPLFSIIIPTYNRPERLRDCLISLVQLNDTDTPFEVIVVDDGGETNLEPVIAPFTKSLNIRLLRQSNAGPAAARNAGSFVAEGRYLAFSDDDCQPQSEWLQNLKRLFHRYPESVITGRTVNSLPDNIFSITSQLLIDYLYRYYNADGCRGRFFTASNLAFPAGVFRELKGFDPSFPNAAGEDRELCRRWIENGRQVIYDPDIIVYHQHDLSLISFWKQHSGYGFAAYQYHRIIAERAQARIHMEPLSFYLGLICYPFQRRLKMLTFPIVILMAISQVANLAGFIRHRFQKSLVSAD